MFKVNQVTLEYFTERSCKVHLFVVTLLVTNDSENSICLSDVMSLSFMLAYHLERSNEINYNLEESI